MNPEVNPAYVYGFQHLERWCAREGLSPLPASHATVAQWVETVPLAPASLAVYLQGIRARHEQAGHPDPTRDPLVRETLARRVEARRRRYCRCPEPPPPLGPRVIDRLRPLLPTGRDAPALRDRAWLLLAYGGGLHAKEMHGLRRRQLVFTPQGLVVDLPGGVAVIRAGAFRPADPGVAADDWLAAGEIEDRLFTGEFPRFAGEPLGAPGSPQDVLTPSELASGLLGDARRAGAPLEALERHSGRRGDLQVRFRDALTRRVGL